MQIETNGASNHTSPGYHNPYMDDNQDVALVWSDQPPPAPLLQTPVTMNGMQQAPPAMDSPDMDPLALGIRSSPEAGPSKINHRAATTNKQSYNKSSHQKPPIKTAHSRQRKDPTGPTARAMRNPYCNECDGNNLKNLEGKKENMLSCWTCGKSGA